MLEIYLSEITHFSSKFTLHFSSLYSYLLNFQFHSNFRHTDASVIANVSKHHHVFLCVPRVLKRIYFLFTYTNICMSICPHEWKHQKRLEEGIESPRIRVTGVY